MDCWNSSCYSYRSNPESALMMEKILDGKGKRLLILGAGESGLGAAVLGLKQGFQVLLSDQGVIKPKYQEMISELGIDAESGSHERAASFSPDLVIKSPGIPEKAPIIRSFREAGLPVIGEIEFASWFTNARIVAITGSNGKSTTTALIHHMLVKAGVKAGLGGNIGKSFALQVAQNDLPDYVLEISSFQLDDSFFFKPNISILTNITPDHLDRYNYRLENYVRSKFSISRQQEASDYFIYCADDPISREYLNIAPGHPHQMAFSHEEKLPEGAWVEDDQIHFLVNNQSFNMPIHEISIKGRHNTYNSMAAGIVGALYGLRKEQIKESLSDFKGLNHRLESITRIKGVEYINDSKATNVNSTWYALESMSKPVVWIAGGIDKGNDYSVLEALVRKKVKALVCLGADNTKLHAAFSRHVDVIVNTSSMQDAVKMAYQLANSGDAVLLSPACASFDLFENYEDRGDKFRDAVIRL